MYLLPRDNQLEAIYGKWQTRKVAPQTSKSACLLEIGATVVSEDAQVEDSHSDRCQLCGLQFSTFTRRHLQVVGLLVCWYAVVVFVLNSKTGGCK